MNVGHKDYLCMIPLCAMKGRWWKGVGSWDIAQLWELLTTNPPWGPFGLAVIISMVTGSAYKLAATRTLKIIYGSYSELAVSTLFTVSSIGLCGLSSLIPTLKRFHRWLCENNGDKGATTTITFALVFEQLHTRLSTTNPLFQYQEIKGLKQKKCSTRSLFNPPFSKFFLNPSKSPLSLKQRGSNSNFFQFLFFLLFHWHLESTHGPVVAMSGPPL